LFDGAALFTLLVSNSLLSKPIGYQQVKSSNLSGFLEGWKGKVKPPGRNFRADLSLCNKGFPKIRLKID